MSQAYQEGSRRGEAPAEVEIAEADAGYQTRSLVLSESSTEWYRAIECKDCKTLMTLLRLKGSALVRETGKAGRTALHVAAIQGSLELLNTIGGFSAAIDGDSLCGLISAIDGRCKMEAREIASDILGYSSREWKKSKKSTYEDLKKGDEKFTTDLIFSAEWRSKYELIPDDIKSIEQMITSVWTTYEGRYKGLMDSFQQNVDYNFGTYEIYGNLFLFHHACSRVDGLEFVKDVIKHCGEGGKVGLDKLMQLRDFQGRTPLHVAVAVAPAKDRDDVLWTLCFYLRENRDWSQYLGVRDGRGWTLLHLAATQPYSHVFRNLFVYGDKVMRTRGADAIETEEDCTTLHLAVFHNNTEVVRVIRDLVRDPAQWRYMISRRIKYKKSDFEGWSVLALAMLLGNQGILDILMSGNEWITDCYEIPITCLVAYMGNTEILRQVLNDARFDPFKRDAHGGTALHYAAGEFIRPKIGYQTSLSKTMPDKQAYPYVSGIFVTYVVWLDELHESSPHESSPHEGQRNKGYSGRKGCINMLLQAGLDIWQKDNDDKFANPGCEINDDEFISWWHEKMAKEALDLRNNLNQGGNAISVIGALIATASYVGPLQPPLSYGSDPSMQLSPTSDNTGYAHVWDPYVKIFMVSNSLSFYLAIASIMLVVVPSLPMPQQALLNELGRTRRTVALAICVLLLSVVGILVSYATASIAVMPNHTSLINARWTSYPASVGAFACLIGIVLFLNRVMRLMYPEMCRWFGKVLWKPLKVLFWVCMSPFMVLFWVGVVLYFIGMVLDEAWRNICRNAYGVCALCGFILKKIYQGVIRCFRMCGRRRRTFQGLI